MYLIYVDESGEVTNQQEKTFVLGAAVIYENQVYYLTQSLDKIQRKWFPNTTDSIEFHSAKILNGMGEPWHSMQRAKRIDLLSELCGALTAIIPRALSLFGVAINKPSFPSDDIVEKSFQELCGHVDAFIEASNVIQQQANKKKDRGLIILDSSQYHGRLDKLLLAYRKQGGTSFGRVKNFADAPTFADSATTRLLQVADLVSYSIYRRYEKSDTSILDKLLPRFSEKDGKIHGLMHLVNNYKQCPCPACISRRD